MANLGDTSQPSGQTGTASNLICLQRCFATQDGPINSIECYTQCANASYAEEIFLIFNGSAIAPSTLLGQSAAFFGLPDGTMGLRTADLLTPPTVVNGNYYWVGVQIEHDSSYVSAETSAPDNAWTYYDAASFGAIPSDMTGLGSLIAGARFGFSATYGVTFVEYDYTATGGVVLDNTSTVQKTKIYSGSSGIVFGSDSSISKSKIYSSSSGLVFGNTSTNIKTKLYSSSSGIVFGSRSRHRFISGIAPVSSDGLIVKSIVKTILKSIIH